MSKKLVAFFSATGTTKKASERLAEELSADIYEIEPTEPYSKADLNWLNPLSRSSKEMKKKIKPEIISKPLNLSEYDIIFIGYPVWWYIAPTIINSFLESYDFSNKKIVLFAPSGGSGFGKSVANLQDSAPSAQITEGAILNNESAFEQLINEYK